MGGGGGGEGKDLRQPQNGSHLRFKFFESNQV